MPRDWSESAILYTPGGTRKYLNLGERSALLGQLTRLKAHDRLFVLMLIWTGARVSEVLGLTASSFQIGAGVVALRTLKRRRFHVREVPIPPELEGQLIEHFHLAERQADPLCADERLWPVHRTTAWRIVKRATGLCSISGSRACPRGLRHAFGVNTLQSGVPINLVQRWLGHARISTTTIYTSVCGPDELEFARRFWRASSAATS